MPARVAALLAHEARRVKVHASVHLWLLLRGRTDTERLVPVLLTLFVPRRPQVLALNKWTKVFLALSFWCVATNLFHFFGRLWELVFTEAALKKADSWTPQPDLTAPVSSDALSTINVVRAGTVM